MTVAVSSRHEKLACWRIKCNENNRLHDNVPQSLLVACGEVACEAALMAALSCGFEGWRNSALNTAKGYQRRRAQGEMARQRPGFDHRVSG